MIRFAFVLAFAALSLGCLDDRRPSIEGLAFTLNGVMVYHIVREDGEQSITLLATDEFARSQGWEDTRVQVTAIKKTGSSEYKLYRVSYEWNGGNHRSDMLWYRPSSAPEVEGWKKRFDVMYNVIKDGLRKEAV